MTCREIADFLMEYDNHELQEEVRAEFERHLGLCPPCVAYLHTYRETVTMVKAACVDPDSSATQAIPEELVHAIVEARNKGRH